MVRAAPAGAALVPLGAQRRSRAGDPGGARKDQLGPDEAGLADRPAPLHLLEGTAPPRRLSPASQRPTRNPTPLRMDRSRRAAAYRRSAAGQIRGARPLGNRTARRATQDSQGRQRLRHRCDRRPHPPCLLRAAQRRERHDRLRDPQACSALDARTRLRPRPSRNERQRPKGTRFAETLTSLGARRFFGTLDTEWAHARTWPNSNERDRALSSFMRFYNRRRPHSAASGRPPISRIQQVRG